MTSQLDCTDPDGLPRRGKGVQVRPALALVTGASTGIGAATARALAADGAHVLVVARSKPGLDDVVAGIVAAGGRATAYPADLSDPQQIAALAEALAAEHGTPDVLVNNAGVGRFLYLDETEPDELRTMTDVPYLAALLVTRHFLPAMLERGSGRIVFVNSPVSRLPWPGATAYAASRWALRGLATTLRMDLRGTGVGVTEVVPGKVTSDYFANNPGAEDRIPRIAALVPALTPEQVATAVVDAVHRGRAEVLLPWQLKAFELGARIAPSLTGWLSWRTGAHRVAQNKVRNTSGQPS